MPEMRRNIVVGVFVLLGLLGIGGLAVLFGNNPTWLAPANTYPLIIQFRSAGGIKPGNIVTVNGIEVGRVTSVNLFDPQNLDADYNVRVEVAIRQQYRIPDGSTAVTSEPVFGQGRPNIQIEPAASDNPPLAAGARLTGRVLGAVETLFPSNIMATFTNTAEQIRETGAALTPVLEDMHELLDRRSPFAVDANGVAQGNLSSAVARLDELLKNFNDLVVDAQQKGHLGESFANIYQVTEDAKIAMGDIKLAAQDARTLMSNAQQSLDTATRAMTNVETRVSDLGSRFSNSLIKADQFLDNLNRITLPISRGEGTIGRLVMDNDLYEAVVVTIKRLAATITDYQLLAKEWQKGKVKVSF